MRRGCRNLLIILMSLELMLSASNIALISFSSKDNLEGHAIVLLIFVVAACEAAVGLAIIVSLFRLRGTIDIGSWKKLKG